MIWIVGIGVLAVLALVIVPGVYLMWPLRHDPAGRMNLGISLMTGAVVAISILLIQVFADIRLRDSDARRQLESARANLQLTISTQRNLTALKLEGDLRGLYMYNKILRDAVFVDVDLRDVVLSGSDLSGARFYNTRGNVVDLDGANLDYVKTPTRLVSFTRASFREAILTHAELGSAQMDNAHLELADLTQAQLSNASLRGAWLPAATLSDARLIGADLTGATLDGETTMDGADLSGAILERAALSGVDLRNAILSPKTDLRGAVYDSMTLWPRSHQQPPCPREATCKVQS
jgi:uncharacterized protein YjbI with pentapeptide repeats